MSVAASRFWTVPVVMVLLLSLALIVSALPPGDNDPMTYDACFLNTSPSNCRTNQNPYCIACGGSGIGVPGCALHLSDVSASGPFYLSDTDADHDGYYVICGQDCDDTDVSVNPGVPSESGKCGDTKDNDCDTLTDADDPDCVGPALVLDATAVGSTVTLTATSTIAMACRWSNVIVANYDALGSGQDMNPTDDSKTVHLKTLTGVSSGSHTYYAYCRAPPPI